MHKMPHQLILMSVPPNQAVLVALVCLEGRLAPKGKRWVHFKQVIDLFTINLKKQSLVSILVEFITSSPPPLVLLYLLGLLSPLQALGDL